MSHLPVDTVVNKTLEEIMKVWMSFFTVLIEELGKRLNEQKALLDPYDINQKVLQLSVDYIDSMRREISEVTKDVQIGDERFKFKDIVAYLFEASANNIVLDSKGFDRDTLCLAPLRKGFSEEKVKQAQQARKSMSGIDYERWLKSREFIDQNIDKFLSEQLAAYRKEKIMEARAMGVKNIDVNSIQFSLEQLAGLLCGPEKEKILMTTLQQMKEIGILPLHDVLHQKGAAGRGSFDMAYILNNDHDSGLLRYMAEYMGSSSIQKIMEREYLDSFNKFCKENDYINYTAKVNSIIKKRDNFMQNRGMRVNSSDMQEEVKKYFTREELDFINVMESNHMGKKLEEHGKIFSDTIKNLNINLKFYRNVADTRFRENSKNDPRVIDKREKGEDAFDLDR